MQALQEKVISRGFAVKEEDLKKIEEIKEFFNAKNNSEAVRIAIDLAYSITQGDFPNELETE